MNLRSALLLFSACLSVTACDGDAGESTSAADSTTGSGSTSGSDPTAVSVSISASATTPTTDPSTTDATAGETDTSQTTAAETEGSTTDPTAGETDGTTTDPTTGETGSTTGGIGGTTIYDVQDGTIAEGETVTLQGVVITGLRPFVGVVVQEIEGGEYSGVYVDAGDIDLGAFAVGDIVDVTGVTAESNPGSTGLDGLTQILIGKDGTMTATGETMMLSVESVDFAVLADPETAEPWESVLVTTSGAFEAVAATETFGQFGEFAVSDGNAMLTVDNFLYAIFSKENAADFPGFGVGASFTAVSGILNYSFGAFKLAPRSAAELEGYAPPAG